MKHKIQALLLFITAQFCAYLALGQHYAYLSQSTIAIEKYQNGGFKLTDSVVSTYNKYYGRSGTIAIDEIVRASDCRETIFEWRKTLPYSELEDFSPDGQGGFNNVTNYLQSFDHRQATKNDPFGYDRIIERVGYKLGNEIEREKFEYKSMIPYGFNILTARVTNNVRQDYKRMINYHDEPDTILVSILHNGTWLHTMTISNIFNGAAQISSTRIDSGAEHTVILRDYTTTPGPLTIVTIKGGTLPDDTVEMISYTYGTFSKPVTETKMVQNPQGNLENYEAHYNTLDANGDKTEDMTLYWNTTAQQWDTFSRGMYTYYTKGVVKSYESMRWDKQNGAWVYMQDTNDFRTCKRINIIYAVDWQTNVTQDALPETNGLVLYPSPAHNTITIQATFLQPQPIAATITDMQGRVLRTWREPSTKDYIRTIPVADLPAANYVLQLNEMVKQFVVR